MNLLERVLTLLRANLNTVVEKADDPEKILRQLQLDMRNQLVQVKTQVATAIAESHRLRKHIQAKTGEANDWLAKAKQAVQQGNDSIARAALTRYDEIIRQVKRYQQQKVEQDQLVATLRKALEQLEAKISEVETNINVLLSSKNSALTKQRAYEAINKVGSIEAKENTARARDAIIDIEARARAEAEMHKYDLDAQFDAIEREQQQTKARQKRQAEPLLLKDGSMPYPDPLLRPQPRSGEPAHKRSQTNKQAERVEAEAQAQLDLDRQRLKEWLDTRPEQSPS